MRDVEEWKIRQGHESIGILVDTLYIYYVYCTKYFEISVAFGHRYCYYMYVEATRHLAQVQILHRSQNYLNTFANHLVNSTVASRRTR